MLLDTEPEHWRCRVCDNREPHVHEHGEPGKRYWQDYGYDIRDESRGKDGLASARTEA